MDFDLIYDRRITPPGIKIETISGGGALSAAVRKALARQVWCENGKEGYRAMDHLPQGAPIIEGEDMRISVTHTPELFIVASLPRTPETDLGEFALRTALGVDAEVVSREQVMRIRDRFLNAGELQLIPDDLRSTLLAWTAKEAAYKAALAPGMDWREQILITELPDPQTGAQGKVAIRRTPDAEPIELDLYSEESEGHYITLAYSPKCATYKKRNK